MNLNECETRSTFEGDLDIPRSTGSCMMEVLGDGIIIKVTKRVTVAIKRLRHSGNLYKMSGSMMSGSASIDMVKNLTSILKKSVLTEKFKESWTWYMY